MSLELREKYAEERNKRLRPDKATQYTDVRSSTIEDLGRDPWADYDALAQQDPPLKHGDKIKFLITGAGHNGLLFAYHLVNAGFPSTDIVLVDVAGGFGGTWYWNRYPGLMCDVEGYVYLPLLEETGFVPKHRYSYGPEIRGQSERIAARWNLRGLFCTKVDSQVWDEEAGCWKVDMMRSLGPGREAVHMTVRAQFVLLAGGVLSIPKVPSAPGLGEFRRRNHMFHTSRWDYAFTGGSQEKPDMVNLRDKRVAIIGTGATAIQCVPQLAKWAKHLYVIQRTPSYCGERNQTQTTPEFWAKVATHAGWQRDRSTNFNHFITNDPAPVDLVNDGWTHTTFAGLVGGPKEVTPDTMQQHIDALLQIDQPVTDNLRARIEREVKDPAVAEKLKPWYPGWCKRPTFNDEYLAAFNRPNVTLVDTDGRGIERYTQHGVVVGAGDGTEIEVDVLVMATGFVRSTAEDPGERIGCAVVGRGGRSVGDKWGGDDVGTLYGVATHRFPNLFGAFVSGAAGSPNMTSMYDINARLVAHVVAEAERRAVADRVVVEVDREAEGRYTDEIVRGTLAFAAVSVCTPGYFNSEGYVPESEEEARRSARMAPWGKGIVDYTRMVEEYMKKTACSGLEGFSVGSL